MDLSIEELQWFTKKLCEANERKTSLQNAIADLKRRKTDQYVQTFERKELLKKQLDTYEVLIFHFVLHLTY